MRPDAQLLFVVVVPEVLLKILRYTQAVYSVVRQPITHHRPTSNGGAELMR